MQKQQAQQCDAEAEFAKQEFRSSRRYTIIQKKQVLQSNEEVAGATL
jgi:hypothetical protein